MNLKKINYLIIASIITVFSACEKDDSTSTNTTATSKAGTFKGTFTYKDGNIDTTFVNYEITLTKIADNKYNAVSADGALDIDVIDNNGTLTVTDEFKAVYSNFTGTLSSSSISIQSSGDNAGNLFQIGYTGAKVTTPVTAEAYYTFDDTTVACNPSSVMCGMSTGTYKNFYFEMYGVNSSIGGSLVIRTDTVATPGTYRVVDYEEYYSGTLDPDECVVSVSKNMFTGVYQSTGTSGTLVVTQSNGKLSFNLTGVAVDDFNGNIVKTLSIAKGTCR